MICVSEGSYMPVWHPQSHPQLSPPGRLAVVLREGLKVLPVPATSTKTILQTFIAAAQMRTMRNKGLKEALVTHT